MLRKAVINIWFSGHVTQKLLFTVLRSRRPRFIGTKRKWRETLYIEKVVIQIWFLTVFKQPCWLLDRRHAVSLHFLLREDSCHLRQMRFPAQSRLDSAVGLQSDPLPHINTKRFAGHTSFQILPVRVLCALSLVVVTWITMALNSRPNQVEARKDKYWDYLYFRKVVICA